MGSDEKVITYLLGQCDGGRTRFTTCQSGEERSEGEGERGNGACDDVSLYMD